MLFQLEFLCPCISCSGVKPKILKSKQLVGILNNSDTIFNIFNLTNMKKIKTLFLSVALMLAPMTLATGATSCYPCGERLPGVACPPDDSECEIE